MAYYSLLEDLGLLGVAFLHVFRWRLKLMQDLTSKCSYKVKELYIVYEQSFHTLVEIVLSPMMLFVMIHPSIRRQTFLIIHELPIEM